MSIEKLNLVSFYCLFITLPQSEPVWSSSKERSKGKEKQTRDLKEEKPGSFRWKAKWNKHQRTVLTVQRSSESIDTI